METVTFSIRRDAWAPTFRLVSGNCSAMRLAIRPSSALACGSDAVGASLPTAQVFMRITRLFMSSVSASSPAGIQTSPAQNLKRGGMTPTTV
jgi:hypothetical protein